MLHLQSLAAAVVLLRMESDFSLGILVDCALTSCASVVVFSDGSIGLALEVVRLAATVETATKVSRSRLVTNRATRVQIVDHIPALTEPDETK